MRVESTVNAVGETIITAWIEKKIESSIVDEAVKAVEAVAKEYVRINMDLITAKLDLSGLANLIAIYAANKLAESAKK